MTSHIGGPFVLDKYVDETHLSLGRGTVANQTLIDDADERLASCMCLINSDQTKHESIIEIVNSQKSLKMTSFLNRCRRS